MTAHIFILILGFVFLIKGADLLVEGSAALAKRLNVTDLFIGLTIVAFGTSTPELFVNIFASIQGRGEIVLGNILGSNVANILLILGIAALLCPVCVTKRTTWTEIPLSLLAAILVLLLGSDQVLGQGSVAILSRADGIVLLIFFIIFLYYTFSIARDHQNELDPLDVKVRSVPKSVSMLVLGLAGLMLGGHWVVKGAVHLAAAWGMSEKFVGLTIVAVGTSLPELATSVAAASKKNMDIAVGNVIGSNIYNIFFILGLSASLRPVPFPGPANADVLAAILASLFLFLAMFTGRRKRVDRWEGVVFLVLYTGYLIFLFNRG